MKRLVFFFLISALLFTLLTSCITPSPTKPSIQKPPVIGAFLNLDTVDGINWPFSSTVTIKVFSAPKGTLLFTGTANTNSEEGHFYVDVGVDLVTGMLVVVTNGTFTKEVTLVSLTVDLIDQANDSVSGTVSAGSVVDLNVSDGIKWVGLSVTADDIGAWTGNFKGLVDIKRGCVVQSATPDGDGDSTVVKIGI